MLPAAESLVARNTLALEAYSQALLEISNDTELVQALNGARRSNTRILVLGEGSNVVLVGNLQYLVLVQCSHGIEILEDQQDFVRVRVAAGEKWHSFVEWSLEQGYFGLENLALIPGTVGAAPIQNIGAYGVELERYVEAVHGRLIDSSGSISLSNEECEFSYRDSIFKHRLRDRMVITQVDFKLSKQPRLELQYPALANALENKAGQVLGPQDVFDAVVQIRQSKLPDPGVVPNAGSFFKNPLMDASHAETLKSRFPDLPVYPQSDGKVKVAAAWLIDYCGWKGYREKGVGVHPEHALVLVNYAASSGVALLHLAEKITDSVKQHFALELEIEPRIYGAISD
jgi:UDP-N-acetylmuramate dehydrogenase